MVIVVQFSLSTHGGPIMNKIAQKNLQKSSISASNSQKNIVALIKKEAQEILGQCSFCPK